MTLFQRLRNKVLISIRRKKNYSMHYKMWDYIAARLQSDSECMLDDSMYISKLKKRFLEISHYKKAVFKNCFLCDLYYGTLKCHDCRKCPLRELYNTSCVGDNSPFRTVCNMENTRAVRVEAAKKIRDCVLIKGGK